MPDRGRNRSVPYGHRRRPLPKPAPVPQQSHQPQQPQQPQRIPKGSTPQHSATPPHPTPHAMPPAPARRGRSDTGRHRRAVPWHRALGYGLISGSLSFILLMVSVAFPDGDDWLPLWLAVTLVVPPALAARRYSRRDSPPQPLPPPVVPPIPNPIPVPSPAARAAPDSGAAPDSAPNRAEPAPAAPSPETEQIITQYGEVLRTHPFSPGPDTAEEHLTDYRTALDAYEEARTAAPTDLPAVLARGQAALNRLPDGPDSVAWNHGEGPMTLCLDKPSPGALLLLAYESPSSEPVRIRARSGRTAPWQTLVDGRGPTLDCLPIPTQDGSSLDLDISTSGPWRAALVDAADLRTLTGRLTGRGSEVITRGPASTPVTFAHLSPGPFTVRRLTRTFRPGPVLARGSGQARLRLAVPAKTALRITTDGHWAAQEHVPKETGTGDEGEAGTGTRTGGGS